MPPASLALLLAGPVLRRVTPTSVSVWVATSQSCHVTVDVYGSSAFLNRTADAQTGTASAPSVGTGTRPTVRVGASLHIAVVTAAINGVPPNTLCSYNITLNVTGTPAAPPGWTGTWDLGGLKMLAAGRPKDDYAGGLGYAENQLPGFPTPPDDVVNLRLVHGSCFKMHGEGPNAFPGLDDIIGDALTKPLTDPDGRPHLLALTGDQIYADDVATCLSPALTSIGKMLVGPETVPVPGSPEGTVDVTQKALPAGRRQKLVRVQGGLSSNFAHSHLIGFGEFAALYLLSWTGRSADPVAPTNSLWPEQLARLPDKTATDNLDVVLDPDHDIHNPQPINELLTPLFTGDDRQVLVKLLAAFETERADVVGARDDGDHVRRALANVPVLMICDDHDVSDDWFMTGAWRARVLASTLGRAVVRNALIAYVLFQGWGNAPDRYEMPGTPEAQFLALVPSLFTGSTGPDPQVCAQVDSLLGLNDPTGADGTPRVAFHYHQDLAGVRFVVLDTRTHREYSTPDGPPGLLSAAALDAQLPISLTDDVPLLIVVSPAPVLGPRLIEEVFSPLAARAYDVYHLALRKANEASAEGIDTRTPFGDIYFDVEAWSSRPAAFERFLSRLTRCPSVVVLAGDVHYAASYTLDYQRFAVPAADGGVPPADPPPTSSSARVVHFTSSAIRNAWIPQVATFARSIGVAENLERLGMAGSRLGWTRITPPVFTGGDLAGGEARPLRARLQREPVIVPTSGWKDRHQIRHPEWAYVLSPILDTRTDDVRFADLATTGFTQVLSPSIPDAPAPPPDGDKTTNWTNPNGPYSVATALHAANVAGAAVTRGLVFANNLGRVSFSRDTPPNGPLSVSMAVRFVRAHPVTDAEKAHDYVVHTASLATTPYAAPDHVGGV